ncbi:MAG: hypothetical protein Q8P57_03205 [Candidatus Pacearchaeota archaeon]|nr:hypothetical protein [Candidatus Pacearchaeota archaeon]
MCGCDMDANGTPGSARAEVHSSGSGNSGLHEISENPSINESGRKDNYFARMREQEREQATKEPYGAVRGIEYGGAGSLLSFSGYLGKATGSYSIAA